MEDVTDTVFRRLIRRWATRYGSVGPAIMFTEFTRVDGAIRAYEAWAARRPANGRLQFTEIERPLFAQLWGTRPEEFFRAAEAVEALGFDGIDLNFGCPARKIRKAGACSALIGTPKLAGEIISACRSGSSLPLSVKTRVGLDRVVTEEWIGFLLDQRLNAITCHGRIADEMSESWADWREVRRAVAMRDRSDARAADGTRTVIIGNGDVRSIEHGRRLAETTGADGIMIGRGVFTDPLVFSRIGSAGGNTGVAGPTQANTAHTDASAPPHTPPSWVDIPLCERLSLLREHVEAFTEHWGDRRNYEVLKKFYRNYATPDARGRSVLEQLYASAGAEEALAIIRHAIITDA